ncbi:MAG TPA: TrkA family potassium uptake protein [Lachnospiraceae bacterium]|nr:TrkA family potassium uptake protein [Lachnospiraceae bacterium]
MKSYAVLGLGRFGTALAKELALSGMEVIAADSSEKLVEQVADYTTQAIVADLTDEEAIRELGLHNVDAAAICMSESLEASVLCIMIAKELGIPQVVAKAPNRRIGEIYKKVGADKVIFPEEETGIRTAHMMMSANFLDFQDISTSMRLVEIKPKKQWIGKTLYELELRKKYGLNIVAIVTKDGDVESNIRPDAVINESDLLWAFVSEKNIRKLE